MLPWCINFSWQRKKREKKRKFNCKNTASSSEHYLLEYKPGNYLHRFLWEQKIAKKVKVCKRFAQLSSCTLFMGAKSCEKSLETFTFDNNRAIWRKSLQTFCVANVAEEKVARRKKYRFGVRQNHELFSRVTHPYSL